MAKRVFELAKDLDVTSKDILNKCRAEGLDLKNHMAVLSVGLEATIREWFTPGATVTAVETAEQVDLNLAHEQAHKQRRRRKKDEEDVASDDQPAAVADDQFAEPAEAELAADDEPAAGVETPVGPEVVAEIQLPEIAAETPAPTHTHAPAVVPAAEAVVPGEPDLTPLTEMETPAETIVPAAPEQPAHASVVSPDSAAPAAKEPAPKAEPEVGPDSPKATVRPAGPQLVPKPAQLRGPRVVRVERPDFIRPPVRRSPMIQSGSGPSSSAASQRPPVGPPRRGKAGAVTPPDEGEDANKKGKRRSPRRRGTGVGGRSAESGTGEQLKEWRDQDLIERSERLAAATGGLRRHRSRVGGKAGDNSSGAHGGQIEVPEPVTVRSLSAAMGIKTADIIRKLMAQGQIVTVNQVLTREIVEQVATDYEIELVFIKAKTPEDELCERLNAMPKGELTSRAPVVAFLGHVDHGKTSLLDYIRKCRVAAGEAGGITQHMGAYRYDNGDRHVVFLDTPGHEAFTAMRSRGANMTDVVVLVVAADDGVMPQTIEAISHAKAAEVPIVVALNKTDLPGVNIQRVLGQLAEQKLNPRIWGGDVEVIETSATTGKGIDDLVEVLSLEAELLELKADKSAPASGYVIEANMNSGRGALARLLVIDGTLKVGDILLAGRGYGRVRAIVDDLGNALTEAGPATPVEVSGLDEVPEAGDKFYAVDSLEEARNVAEDRRARSREKLLANGPRPASLEAIISKIAAGEVPEVRLIIRADMQGSVEAIVGALGKVGTEEARVTVLHAGVGGITTGDVTLAEASKAVIIGFNVVPDAAARRLAEEIGVDIRGYRIIYEILDDIRQLLEKGLTPEVRQEVRGHADVRQVIKVSRVGGFIAGCYVTDGVASRNSKVRITRNNIVIEDARSLESLRRFKEDVREVRAGLECGIRVAGYDDLKEGDVLEFYQQVEVARKL